VQLDAQVSVPHVAAESSCGQTAELVRTLGRALHVVKTPMVDAVARLDTCGPNWVLYLDSGCPLKISAGHCSTYFASLNSGWQPRDGQYRRPA
jgi:hypothetical protein